MKCRIQFTPALAVALLCAAGWATLWLFAFHPAPVRAPLKPFSPAITRLSGGDEIVRTLQQPTLFALPSKSGFSGDFIADRIELRLVLEKPASPASFLPNEPPAAIPLDRATLLNGTGLPQSGLPVPGTTPRTPIQPLTQSRIFLSPELALRAGNSLQLDLTEPNLPDTLRVWITIRPDGTVDRVLFDSPNDSPGLLRAIRTLSFKPSETATEGWMDIRFVRQEEEK